MARQCAVRDKLCSDGDCFHGCIDMLPEQDRPRHCAYCKAGFDRTAESGGKTFIHILTRGAEGQILKWHQCTRSAQHF